MSFRLILYIFECLLEQMLLIVPCTPRSYGSHRILVSLRVYYHFLIRFGWSCHFAIISTTDFLLFFQEKGEKLINNLNTISPAMGCTTLSIHASKSGLALRSLCKHAWVFHNFFYCMIAKLKLKKREINLNGRFICFSEANLKSI